ncbi:MAG: pyridoxal-dependent decarboxylase [archaeon]|nr:pyridoxal-dependent decarboxylase [archaeon]
MEYLRQIQHFIFKGLKFGFNKLEAGHNLGMSLLPEEPIYNIYVKNKIMRIEDSLKNYSPLTLILSPILIYLILSLICRILKAFKKSISKYDSPKDFIVAMAMKLPSSKNKMAKAKEEAKADFEKIFKVSKFKKLEFRDNGQDKNKILIQLNQISRIDDEVALSSKLTGAVYCQDDEVRRIANEAANIYTYSNLLHPDIYCSARSIESQLIKIGIDLFHGKQDACGMTTSGGTYSILTALFTYRRRGESLGIEHPNIVLPESAHAAFLKGCDMFGIEIRKISYGKDYQVDLNKVKKAINKNTICIVGSFPNFPHCVADDIEGLSKIAVSYKVPLHVDCCLGGFLVAFFEKGNIKTPLFDFRLPGVTSISADLHKYGLCPKGISLLLFATHELRKHCYFIYPHWPGGLYATPHFDGSRSAGLIVASYAVLISMGKNVYVNIAKKINECVRKVKKVIDEELDLIKVIGQPFICGVAFEGKYIEQFYDGLSKKGWHVNFLMNPKGLNFIFTSANMKNCDQFINDLKEVHQMIKEGKAPELSQLAKLYGMTLPMPERAVKGAIDVLLDCMLD